MGGTNRSTMGLKGDKMHKTPDGRLLRSFNKEIYKIDYWCYLSGEIPTETREDLATCNIKRLCNCTRHVPFYFSVGDLVSDDDLRYHRAPVGESTMENFVQMMEEAGEFIQRGRAINEYVLLHCTTGVNMAATVLAAFFIRHQSMDLGAALIAIKTGCDDCPGRPGINPSQEMMQRLVMYEELIHGAKRVKEFRSSDDPWWCMYKRGGQGLLNEGTSLAMPKWKRDAAEKPAYVEQDKVMDDGEEYELHAAIVLGQFKMVRHLIVNMGIDVEGYNGKKATALFLAATDNQLELLKFLVEEGKANVEHGIRDGMAPLFPAAQNGHCEVIRYLVRDAGANVDPHASLDSRVTPLFYACKEGKLDAVKTLIKLRADPNHQLEDGTTPIFIACEYGQLAVVQFLVREAKVLLDCPRSDGKTPIRIASEQGHAQILRCLVADGGASWETLSDQIVTDVTTWPTRAGYDAGVQCYQRSPAELYNRDK